VGLFFFAMFFLGPHIIKPLGNAVTAVSGIPGKLLGYYEVFPQYSLIFISRNNTFISFYIDYECSGLVEILAFTALLWFFPVYDTAEKAIISIVGIAWIFTANVIRILIISGIICYFGDHVFYFAHTVFGRIVFYGFSVVMYFYVFTKSHVVRQKVGQFSYAGAADKNN
jgi:exosortase family protein XrtG